MLIRTTLEFARAHKRYLTTGERKNQMLPIRAGSLPGSKLRKTEYLLEVSAFYLANYQFADAAKVARIALRQELDRWFNRTSKLMPRSMGAALAKLYSGSQVSRETYTKLIKLLDKKRRFTISDFEDCLNALRTMAGLPAGKLVAELRQPDPRQVLIDELRKTYSVVYPRKEVFNDPQTLLYKLRTGCHVSREMGKRLARLLQAKQIGAQELQHAVQALEAVRELAGKVGAA